MKKSFRIRLNLTGFNGKVENFRTDGKLVYTCCSLPNMFIWERSCKRNGFNPYSGYVAVRVVAESLAEYNPDGLKLS